jgi:hypothetical protein
MKNEIETFKIENEHATDSLRFLDPKNKNILDLGCGRHTDRNGEWTLPLTEYTPIFSAIRGAKKIVGVDSRSSEKEYYDEYFKENFKDVETHFYTSLIENSEQVKTLIKDHDINYIKTDIEGYETLFLTWTKDDFNNVDDFVIEYHTEEIKNSFLNKLTEWGFEIYAQGTTWANGIGVLFTKKKINEIS